jgi:hypothetical protein
MKGTEITKGAVKMGAKFLIDGVEHRVTVLDRRLSNGTKYQLCQRDPEDRMHWVPVSGWAGRSALHAHLVERSAEKV